MECITWAALKAPVASDKEESSSEDNDEERVVDWPHNDRMLL